MCREWLHTLFLCVRPLLPALTLLCGCSLERARTALPPAGLQGNDNENLRRRGCLGVAPVWYLLAGLAVFLWSSRFKKFKRLELFTDFTHWSWFCSATQTETVAVGYNMKNHKDDAIRVVCFLTEKPACKTEGVVFEWSSVLKRLLRDALLISRKDYILSLLHLRASKGLLWCFFHTHTVGILRQGIKKSFSKIPHAKQNQWSTS